MLQHLRQSHADIRGYWHLLREREATPAELEPSKVEVEGLAQLASPMD